YLPDLPRLALSELRATLVYVPLAVPPRLALREERWFPASTVPPPAVVVPRAVASRALGVPLPGDLIIPIQFGTLDHRPRRRADRRPLPDPRCRRVGDRRGLPDRRFHAARAAEPDRPPRPRAASPDPRPRDAPFRHAPQEAPRRAARARGEGHVRHRASGVVRLPARLLHRDRRPPRAPRLPRDRRPARLPPGTVPQERRGGAPGALQ